MIRLADKQRGYTELPAFGDQMSLCDWDDTHHVGLLEDGRSLIQFLEVKDIACEALPPERLTAIYQKIVQLLSTLVPREAVNPWTVCLYCQDDMTLHGLLERLRDYVNPAVKDDPFTQTFVEEIMAEHFSLLCQPKGLFDDPLSGNPFRGRSRRLRLAIYRRHHRQVKRFDYTSDTLHELTQVTRQIMAAFQDLGMKVRRMQGCDVYEWLVRWFNPEPSLTEGNVDALLKKRPYLTPSQRPFGWNLVQAALHSPPVSTPEGWACDGWLHRVLPLAEVKQLPTVGAWSRERQVDGKWSALLDQLPPGAVYTMQMVFEADETVEAHLLKIEKSAVGAGEEPHRIKRDIRAARDAIKTGNHLIRTTQAIFYRGQSANDLADQEYELIRLADKADLAAIPSRYQLYPLDTYLRLLPGNFDHVFEKHNLHAARYLFATDIAALIPLMGRFRGDQLHPLFTFFNRGGEGVMFDPYHKQFKSNNSHMVLFGSSGAGKSVTINYMTLCLLAVMNARVVILEAGGSFDLLTQYLKAQGKAVEYLKFDRTAAIPTNPFIDAYQILDQLDAKEQAVVKAMREKQAIGLSMTEQPGGALASVLAEQVTEQVDLIEGLQATASEAEKQASEDRDILNELALIVRCMITGGDKAEEAAITRADMGRITRVIVETVKRCYIARQPQVLTADIIAGMREAATQDPDHAKRFKDFADSMRQFTTGHLAKFFNSPAAPATHFDYMHIDLGFLKEKGQESGLNVVAISLLSRVLGLAEANQTSDRPTIFIMDEAHLLFKSPMIAAFATLMAKVSRKIGLWLMPATQNISDLEGEETSKLLSMMENWLCLALSKKEISKIPTFRALTPEQVSLLSSVKKYPGVYAEAVLLGENYQGRFRNVPPRLALALAMTEQDEKAERRRLCETVGCTELEAVARIAERLKTARQTLKEDAVFDRSIAAATAQKEEVARGDFTAQHQGDVAC